MLGRAALRPPKSGLSWPGQRRRLLALLAAGFALASLAAVRDTLPFERDIVAATQVTHQPASGTSPSVVPKVVANSAN